MIPEYIQKCKDWPVPKTGMEVGTFLGFAWYYRTFKPKYSALMNWLNRIKKAEKLPDQLHLDNGIEFVNKLWRELFSGFKIQQTTTLLYNPSSNPVECFHQTLTAILWTRRPALQDNWDLWLNASVFAYNTIMSSSPGVTPHYAMFGRKATLPLDWVFPTPSV